MHYNININRSVSKLNILMHFDCCRNDSSRICVYWTGSLLGISSSCWWLPPRASWELGFTVSCSVSLVLDGTVECFILYWKWLALLYCGSRNFIQLSLTFQKGLIIVYDVLKGSTVPGVFCLYRNADVFVLDFVNVNFGNNTVSLCDDHGDMDFGWWCQSDQGCHCALVCSIATNITKNHDWPVINIIFTQSLSMWLNSLRSGTKAAKF